MNTATDTEAYKVDQNVSAIRKFMRMVKEATAQRNEAQANPNSFSCNAF